MAADSKHWADVAKWLYKVVDSCITPMQAINAKKLVRRFNKMYPGDSNTHPREISYQCLVNRCDEKFNTLFETKHHLKNEKRRSNCSDGDIS